MLRNNTREISAARLNDSERLYGGLNPGHADFQSGSESHPRCSADRNERAAQL